MRAVVFSGGPWATPEQGRGWAGGTEQTERFIGLSGARSGPKPQVCGTKSCPHGECGPDEPHLGPNVPLGAEIVALGGA